MERSQQRKRSCLPVVLNEVFIWNGREQHRLPVPSIDSSDLTAGHRLKFHLLGKLVKEPGMKKPR
jgi:hypothetical protein